MIKLIAFLFIFLFSVQDDAIQAPKVAILNANQFTYDESLTAYAKESEFTTNDATTKRAVAEANKNEDREFVRNMTEMEWEFRKQSDISSQFTLTLLTWFGYKLFGIFKEPIVYPIRDKANPTIEDYNRISEEYDVNWVINLKKIDIQKKDEGLQGFVSFELWNKNTNEVTLSTQLEIEDENHGFELTCEEGSINCIMINGASYVTQEILKSMGSDERYWR